MAAPPRAHPPAKPGQAEKERESTSCFLLAPASSLARRIAHINLRWFDFPLPRRCLLHQHGPSGFPGILRFPEGETRERAFFGIWKNVRDENDAWLLFDQFVKLAHLLHPQLFLSRLWRMNRVEDKHGLSFLPHASIEPSLRRRYVMVTLLISYRVFSDPCEPSLAGHQKIEKDSNSIQ